MSRHAAGGGGTSLSVHCCRGKDSKLGLAMCRMASGYEAVNVMWMCAALLARAGP
ncbi:MAG: hypothetical protein M0013_00360 [Actinomycetota bacterium]|nr:hypothetical protein [Actinomycetota bacterium]